MDAERPAGAAGDRRLPVETGYVSETGKTEMGARQLSLTADGKLFRDHGVRWWESLSLFEKLKVTLLG